MIINLNGLDVYKKMGGNRDFAREPRAVIYNEILAGNTPGGGGTGIRIYRPLT